VDAEERGGLTIGPSPNGIRSEIGYRFLDANDVYFTFIFDPIGTAVLTDTGGRAAG